MGVASVCLNKLKGWKAVLTLSQLWLLAEHCPSVGKQGRREAQVILAAAPDADWGWGVKKSSCCQQLCVYDGESEDTVPTWPQVPGCVPTLLAAIACA